MNAGPPRIEDLLRHHAPQVLALYDLLVHRAPEPMAELSRAVALAMVEGPRAGLAAVTALEDRLAGHHRLDAVRAHLLERAGDREAARAAYQRAADHTLTTPDARCLRLRAARLLPPDDGNAG